MSEHDSEKATRAPNLEWVPIAEMTVSVRAQRKFDPAHAEGFAAKFDLEALGYPVVNKRAGHYYIVDGQHRVAALKLIGWEDQRIQCECYDNLSEQEEAELFLRRDERRAISGLDKYQISLTAEREVESHIDQIVRANRLVVSRQKVEGRIQAVGTLRKVYVRSGPDVLGRSLRIIRDAYGDAGLEASVIDGVALLCARYDREFDDDTAVKRLGGVHGGVNGLLNKALTLQKATGCSKAHGVAAAAVDVINGNGRGGRKLATWWKTNGTLSTVS